MQLKIYRMLNTILLSIMVLLAVALVAVFVYVDLSQFNIIGIFVVLIVVNAIIFFGYRYLETNWDRKLILKMVDDSKIALARITQADPVKNIRESTGIRYIMYKFYATVTLPDMSVVELEFYDKLNNNMIEVPRGYVYITYDETKPDHHFIIQNDLISLSPHLEPIVVNYEYRVKGLEYLMVYQFRGLNIQKMEEFIKEQEELAKEEQQKGESK